MIQFIANIVANLIERAFGSKQSTVLTVAAILGGLAASLPNFVSVVPPNYVMYIRTAGAFLAALSGILGYGSKPTAPLPTITK
jgi:F0F1-type ATP synthase assembly protein I